MNALFAPCRGHEAVKAVLALGALLALFASGCSAAAPLVPVDKLLAHCDAFKGKPVQLAGYLGDCGGYECDLAADETHWNAFASALNDTRTHRILADPAKRREASSRFLSITLIGVGGNKAFDRKAASFQHSYVVIGGTIAKDSCDGRGGTDRVSGIDPTEIRAWTRSEGAPAPTK